MSLENKLSALCQKMEIDPEQLPDIYIEEGCLASIPSYLKEKGLSKPILVTDSNTKKAAGLTLEYLLNQEDLYPKVVILDENQNGQVIADGQSIMQLFLNVEEENDVLVAVGSGTIHDICRFCSEKAKVPFLAVPTAASVDGFTSKGAPIINRGKKQTVQSQSPIAVFADTNVLMRAPQTLTAAGFGDMLGKHTSLMDWDISEMIGGEPFYQEAYELTKTCLDLTVKHTDEIGRSEYKGIKALMEALIYSGLAMNLINSSRPASGGEHHLSHFWEMRFLELNEPQLLHGAKVGVACTIISCLYKEWVRSFSPEELTENDKYEKKLKQSWHIIKNKVLALPDVELLQIQLLKVGGPATIEDLGLAEELVTESLNEAFHLRDRCTGLRLINHYKNKRLEMPQDPCIKK
ncbi:sn-glycerol-1-phosphate dehydrogenase [Halobacillus halophilus]|uniref:sn-glycerol-1-phosphate dehydrogenase n=1 Tax=Halobacillus halophilus TaxID=1570 RepID=UPI001CD1AA6E|nr:sn-glycerol-1-phosphate dehydrogenase [Halobacillus halophilus]MCA1011438.1 sn-glycerol-1-phosphate dehydrogenase [Halobacillus halophilus]